MKSIEIGSGITSTVHSDGKYALKHIKWRNIESAMREILFITECKHDNIIKLLDILQTDHIVLCLQLYPCDLSQYKIRGAGDVMVISYGILCGVDYLHARGIIHCDIKPQNILIEPGAAPRPIICDFGLSLRGDEKLHVGVVQTVNYRAPEVNFGKNLNKFTPRVDIWSIGCVIYEMCTSEQLCMYIPGCEDSTKYACGIFNLSQIGSRKQRMERLCALNSVDIKSTIMSRLKQDLDSLLYKSGFISLIAQCLTPNPRTRSDSQFLIRILAKIISREFPEFKHILRWHTECNHEEMPLHNIDDLRVVYNVIPEIIMNTTLQCLNYAEKLYNEYTENTGDTRLEVQLCCIFIASAVYCASNNVLDHTVELMDLETTYALSITILRNCKKE